MTPPTSRAAVTAAAPIPDRRAGTRASTVPTIGATTRPKPTPRAVRAAIVAVTGIGRTTAASRPAQATAASVRPPTRGRAGPRRAAQRAPSGPAATIATVIGAKTPAVRSPP